MKDWFRTEQENLEGDEWDKKASTEEKVELRLRMFVKESVNGRFLTALCLLIIFGIVIYSSYPPEIQIYYARTMMP